MKHIRHILLLVALALVATAQGADLTPQQILSNTAKRIANAKSITASYTSEVGDTEATGTLTMCKQMFAMVSADYGVWYDGTELCSYYKQSGEATLSIPIDDELMEINPFYIINNYQQRYNIKLIDQHQRTYSVLLMAKDARASIKSAMLTINGTTWLPTEIIATMSNDEIIRITITSAKSGDTALPKSAFQFPAAKYPGVEVIDIR